MIILDTSVVSELMRPKRDANVVDWLESQQGGELRTTAVTVAEILYGIERLPSGERKSEIKAAADEALAGLHGRILPFDVAAAHQYALAVAERDRAGRPADGFDAQIAALCRHHRALLATRNISDFTGIGIELIDPWLPRDSGDAGEHQSFSSGA
jgi:toxin FitB